MIYGFESFTLNLIGRDYYCICEQGWNATAPRKCLGMIRVGAAIVLTWEQTN